MPLSRRQFVTRSLGWTAFLCAGRYSGLLGRKAFAGEPEPPAGAPFAEVSPIAEGIVPRDSVVKGRLPFARGFTGDDFAPAHEVLTDPQGFIARRLKGALPEASEKASVVIVGGGIAGLATATLLRGRSPVLLEQAPRFGGNAKGEKWGESEYAIGAAYLIQPDEGDDFDKFYGEVGVKDSWRPLEGHDPVEYRGKIYRKFWEGEAEEAAAAKFEAFAKKMEEYAEDPYPDIPIEDEGKREALVALDRRSLKDLVNEWLGGEVPGALSAAIQNYCHSSFGAGWQQVSAAAGINFIAGEEFGVRVLPGGNAAVARGALKLLYDAGLAANLRAGARVFDVRVEKEGTVRVSYLDAEGNARGISARAAVLACPKFIAGKILRGIEEDRKKAIAALEYHPYAVVNVLLKAAPKEEFYDLFLLRDGAVVEGPPPGTPIHRVTDAICGNWARKGGKEGESALTLYWPIPFPGGRPPLLKDDAWEVFADAAEPQIVEILALLGLKPADAVQVRMTRFGHPLPVAKTGFIADGYADVLRRPIDNKIFFVNQDNWALPAIETSLAEAFAFAPKVEEALG